MKSMKSIKENGFIVTITGPSGCGKSLAAYLMSKDKKTKTNRIITATSRPPRPKEKDGIDYLFLPREEWQTDRFTAVTDFAGNLYGAPKERVKQAFRLEQPSIIIVDARGARILKKKRETDVYNLYIGIRESVAYKHLLRRGKDFAQQRLAIDKEVGLYNPRLLPYDCIVSNDGRAEELMENILNFICAMSYTRRLQNMSCT